MNSKPILARFLFSAILFMLVWPAAQALAQPGDPAFASLDGAVSNNGVNGVVRLEHVPSGLSAGEDGFSAKVAPDGTFHLADIPVGSYRLLADADNQLHGIYGASDLHQSGTVLEIHPGEHLRGFTIQLLPDPPAICGRVLDAAGNPISATVEAYGVNVDLGSVARIESPTQITDTAGRFSFPNLFSQGHFFLRANGTWYPSAASFSGARLLEPERAAKGGKCIEIRLNPDRCKGLTLAVHFADTLKFPVFEYEVALDELNPSGQLFSSQVIQINRSEGTEFQNVCPGQYIVSTRDRWMHPQFLVSPVFEVQPPGAATELHESAQSDLGKIVAAELGQPPLASMELGVTLEGLTAKQGCSSTLTPQPSLFREGDRNPASAVPDKDGLFRWKNLLPGNYRLNYGLVLHNAVSLKTFAMDGKEADPEDFHISPGQSVQAHVVLRNLAGEAQHPLPDLWGSAHDLPAGFHPAASLAGQVEGDIPNDATAVLHSVRFNSARSSQYRSIVNLAGTFGFDHIDPGIYTLSIERPGAPASAYGAKGAGLEGTALIFTAGQQVKGLQLNPFPAPDICGRVVDLRGRPRAGVEVGVRGSFSQSAPVEERTATTDEEGRFDLKAAAVAPYLEMWEEEQGTRTFYPWQPNYRPASVKAEPGGEPPEAKCPYVLQMASPAEGNGGGVTVAGTVAGDYSPADREHLWAVLTPVSDRLAPKPVKADVKDRNFGFQAVTPGEYTLTLMDGLGDAMRACSLVCYGETAFIRDSQKVTVAASPVTGLTLDLLPLPQVTGQLTIDGKPPEPGQKNHWKDWIPELVSSQEGEPPETSKLDEQGRFSFSALGTESYYFLFNYFWPDYAIKKITVDGIEVNASDIRLSYGKTSHMVVDVTTVTSQVKVHSTPTDPPIDPFRDLCANFIGEAGYVALLIPDPFPPNPKFQIIWGRDTNTLHSASFHGILPGRYRLLAFENLLFTEQMSRRVGNQGLWDDKNFVQALAALGKPVDIAEGKSFDVDAPLITEQLQDLLAQLGVSLSSYSMFPR